MQKLLRHCGLEQNRRKGTGGGFGWDGVRLGQFVAGKKLEPLLLK